MKTFLPTIFIFISLVSFCQEPTTIKVSVPNKTDEVYLVGNQETLGNWQPEKVKMNKISEYERELSLQLTFPAEFKFTRGNWNSEAIITTLTEQPNFILKKKPTENLFYKIQGWSDHIQSFSTCSAFKILDITSKILNQKRKLYIALPENYNEKIKYPVVYLTDANIVNLFEIVNQTVRQQSNYGNFPECIIVGILINIRERNNELDIEYSENGKKFKDYIFKEVVPFVDANYSTSSFRAILGHSNGAEYNHFLMFEKDNLFDAFINISENLSGIEKGQFEEIKNKYVAYLNTNKKPLKYFVASAKYDQPFRYQSGLEIEKILAKYNNDSVAFRHNVYTSWHIDLIGRSILDAFNFIFSEYQNYNLFESQLNTNNFKYAFVKKKYIAQNEKYITPYLENDNSTSVIGEMIINTKNSEILKQYLDYEDTKNEIFNLYTRAILFYEANDLDNALLNLERLVKENDESSVQQIKTSKAELFIEIYKKANKLELAYKNLEIVLKKNPKYDKQIKSILAKFGIENTIQIKKSKNYLKEIKNK